ncbi:MAG: helix-turn-helix transcriptional regulator [Methyloligellaceae bacterium]
MAGYGDEYLTTRELADLLRIKERKVYDLAASGDIPCTRALGKLLFQRAAIDAWLARHGSGQVPAASSPPNVFLGSHDPLLEWSLRESESGSATIFDGSLDGLERFARREGIAAGLHVYDPPTDTWNVPAVAERFAHEPVVLVEWAWRERGLIVPPGNPMGIGSVADLAGKRVAPRQPRAGSQGLLDHLIGAAGLEREAMTWTRPARSETDAALAVLEGRADAAFGLRSAAEQYQLGFMPVMRERFDLLVWRREWFEPPFQAFLALCRGTAFRERAAALSGYDISGLGKVHYNG